MNAERTSGTGYFFQVRDAPNFGQYGGACLVHGAVWQIFFFYHVPKLSHLMGWELGEKKVGNSCSTQ